MKGCDNNDRDNGLGLRVQIALWVWKPVSCESCVFSGRSLYVGLIHSSSGVVPSGVCLSVIVKFRQWGGPGPLRAVASWKEKLTWDLTRSHVVRRQQIIAWTLAWSSVTYITQYCTKILLSRIYLIAVMNILEGMKVHFLEVTLHIFALFMK